VIKEKDRREMLARRKIMRRHQTLYKKSKQDFYDSVITSWKNGGMPLEISKLLELSVQRVKQIIYDKEDDQ
jgi:hypothetical protein